MTSSSLLFNIYSKLCCHYGIFLTRVCSALSKPTVSYNPAVKLCLQNFIFLSLPIFIFDFYIVANHFTTFTSIFSPFKLRSVYVLEHGQVLSQVHKQKVQIWFSCSPFLHEFLQTKYYDYTWPLFDVLIVFLREWA